MINNNNCFINLPYLSFSNNKHDASNTTIRLEFQYDEELRIYFHQKDFVFIVKNKNKKRKVMMGIANAQEMAGLIKTKFPKNRAVNMFFYYPEGHKKTYEINKLVKNAHLVNENNFEKNLYKYLILLAF